LKEVAARIGGCRVDVRSELFALLLDRARSESAVTRSILGEETSFAVPVDVEL
jgi:hypothetical protein